MEGPDSPEFCAEAWRVARFIAYDDFVSIERSWFDGTKGYTIKTHCVAGLSIEVHVRPHH